MSAKGYYILFQVIYLSIIFLAFFTGLINYRKKNSKLLPIVILLGCTFASQLINFFWGGYFNMDHFTTPGYVILWGIFFSRAIDDPSIRKLIRILAPALVCFSIIDSIVIQGMHASPNNAMKLATLFNLVMGALLLIQMLDLPSKENVFVNTFFLIALAVVWFSIISSFYFFLYAFTAKHLPKGAGPFILRLHYYSNYVYYSLFFLAMLFQKKLNHDVR